MVSKLEIERAIAADQVVTAELDLQQARRRLANADAALQIARGTGRHRAESD